MTNDAPERPELPDRLARFTPSAGGLDRDEVLFRAGRASARTPWGWKLAVAGLVASNVATLALGTRPAPAPVPPAVPSTKPADSFVEPVVPPVPEPAPASPAVDPLSVFALSRRWGEAEPRPAPEAGPAGRPAKPLTAGSRADFFN